MILSITAPLGSCVMTRRWPNYSRRNESQLGRHTAQDLPRSGRKSVLRSPRRCWAFFRGRVARSCAPAASRRVCACLQSVFESNLQQLSHFGTVALHNERSMVLSNQGASNKSLNLVHKKLLLNLSRPRHKLPLLSPVQHRLHSTRPLRPRPFLPGRHKAAAAKHTA